MTKTKLAEELLAIVTADGNADNLFHTKHDLSDMQLKQIEEYMPKGYRALMLRYVVM